MGNSTGEQTLKELRALKVDLDIIAENERQISTLENNIYLADQKYSWAHDKVMEKYIPVTKEQMQNCVPETEAEKTQKKLPAKVVRKKCLPHAIIVTTMCLVWLIACVIIMNAQLLPDYGTGKITPYIISRALYVLIMVGVLWSTVSSGNKGDIRVGCWIYSIPAAFAAFQISSYHTYFADTTVLLILDAVLGLGTWVLVLCGPFPNKAFYKAVNEIESKKRDVLSSDEKLKDEAKRAYFEKRYQTDKAIIAVQKEVDAAWKKLEDAKKQLEQAKKNIEKATARLQSSTILSWDDLPYAHDPLGRNVMRNGLYAVEFMLSAVERGRADTLEEALESWADEVRRRNKQGEAYEAVYRQTAAEADRRDRIESANREKMREQERRQEKLRKEKEKVEEQEKAIDDLYR